METKTKTKLMNGTTNQTMMATSKMRGLFRNIRNVFISFVSFVIYLLGGRWLYLEVIHNTAILLPLIPIAGILLAGKIRK